MAALKTELEPVIKEIKAAGSQLRGPDAETCAARLDQDLNRKRADELMIGVETSNLAAVELQI